MAWRRGNGCTVRQGTRQRRAISPIRTCEKMPAIQVAVRIDGMDKELSDRAEVLAEQAALENVRLVAAIGAGNREAEREFVERFQQRVKAMLTARTRNADAAADVLQDVLVESICALRKG